MSLISRLQHPSGQRLVARLSSTTSTGRSFWATVPTTISNAGCSSSTTTSAPSLSSSTSLRIPKLRIGTSHRHHHLYHTTPSLYSSGTPGKKQKDRQQADPTPEELSETSDTIPEWQNPRHMNSEEVVFLDTDNLSSSPPPSPLPLPPFETCPDAIVAPPHIEELAQQIVQLNLLELKELVDQIANAFEFDDDVMAASYMNGAALMGASGGAGSSEPVEEAPAKVIFDVKLIGFDAKAKIKVIKEIRAISGLGLKEAKELVEAAPKVFAKDLKQEKADEIKAQLEAVGAQVEIL